MKKKERGGYMKLYRSLLYNKELKLNDVGIYIIIADKNEAAVALGLLEDDGMISLSISEIAELARLDRKTVAKSLEKLEKLHLIAVKRSNGNAIHVSAYSPDDADYVITTRNKIIV